MSIRALNTAASGMDAMQFRLDVIANNLANAQTTAFKTSRVNFEDLFYQNFRVPGLLNSQGRPTSVGQSVGLGVRVQSTELDMKPGSLNNTGNELDLAIIGEGFFQIQDGTQFLYTRSGNFSINANGEIVLASASQSRPLQPAITIPQGTTNISISSDGFVSILQQGQTQLQQIGQIQLAQFINPQGLLQQGDNLYAQTVGSGFPNVLTPGQNGVGTIQQNFLEASNVEPVTELVNMIATQRTFELNSQAVQVADQAWQLVNNLRRF
ncbi:MAG TPA: flagellar basal-body rod protein FlgG [Planctomycetaceae bacterium]|jgi:flagellar basal-body rod protein FlgG